MNGFYQRRGWLLALATAAMMVSSAAAQNSTNIILHTRPVPVPANLTPPSPIDYFRHLLVLSPQQREAALAKKTPDIRTKILAKVNEYSALDPNEREVRLRATELRWYLAPLMRAAPSDRDAQLAGVPENIRDIVKGRLMQWEILPPSLQREFLDNEHVLGYFSGLDSTNNGAGAVAPTSAEQSRWDTLPEGERNAMLGQFNQFFALSPSEKQKAIGGLSNIERAQMEKIIGTLNGLTPLQRVQCLHACGKFASLTPQQRAEFLKDAQRWSQMSPAERKAWADLAAHVPEWSPTAPSMMMPPVPPMPSTRPNFHPLNVTNRS